jgi:Ca2+-transporting ATPase
MAMSGLSTGQAAARLVEIGPNALPERAPDPAWRRFVRQFQSPLIYILLFALVFDAGLWIYEGAHGWPIEALAIAVILLLNAALGLYQEKKSEAALARLKALAAAQAWVLRDGPSAQHRPGSGGLGPAGSRRPGPRRRRARGHPRGDGR